MAYFWFSDPHFGHKNLVVGCTTWDDKSECRNYKSIDEHDGAILDGINSTVAPNDILICGGDWSFGPDENVARYRSLIRCRNIFLCLGNHDRAIRRSKKLQSPFQWIGDRHRLRINKRLFITDHYPLMVWEENNKRGCNAFMLHGHSHDHLNHDNDGLILDIGIESRTSPKPWSEKEIVDYMAPRKVVARDHHR